MKRFKPVISQHSRKILEIQDSFINFISSKKGYRSEGARALNAVIIGSEGPYYVYSRDPDGG